VSFYIFKESFHSIFDSNNIASYSTNLSGQVVHSDDLQYWHQASSMPTGLKHCQKISKGRKVGILGYAGDEGVSEIREEKVLQKVPRPSGK
jgi:hypothetical protein